MLIPAGFAKVIGYVEQLIRDYSSTLLLPSIHGYQPIALISTKEVKAIFKSDSTTSRSY
jgi:hypothetical protein